MADCDSRLGDARLNRTREVTLSLLISTVLCLFTKGRCQLKFPKSHENKKQLQKHIVFNSPYFSSLPPTIWSCATYLTSKFPLWWRLGELLWTGCIWANAGLLDAYGSGLKCSLVVSCIVINVFSLTSYWKHEKHANICCCLCFWHVRIVSFAGWWLQLNDMLCGFITDS